MKLIRNNVVVLTFFISVVAILISAFSYIKAYNAEERARTVEFFSVVKDVAKNLNIEFIEGSLSFNTLNESKNESINDRISRFRDAAIGISLLDNIAQNENEKDGVIFLKLALLLQQKEYEKIDALLMKTGGKYDRIGFISMVVISDYRSGSIADPEMLIKHLLVKDEKNLIGNLIYALLLKDKGDYEKSLQYLKVIEPFVDNDSNLLFLRSEIRELLIQ